MRDIQRPRFVGAFYTLSTTLMVRQAEHVDNTTYLLCTDL